MLDETERENIKLAEDYRHEVRNQLQEKLDSKKRDNRLWAFLNSSFGLWLLSAICITLLGNIYTQRQDAKREESRRIEVARAEELKTLETVERLDSEIGYRLSQIQVRLNQLNSHMKVVVLPPTKIGGLRVMKANGVVEVLNSVHQPPGTHYFATYPEYANYTLIALVAELRRYVKNEERHQLDNVLADLTGIAVLMEVEHADLSNVEQVAGIVNKKFISGSRWFDSGYYFLDCSESSPFC